MAVAGIAGVDGDVTAPEVVRAARRAFLAGDRLDIRGLATSLGIARATIYRWYGGRERILGEVIWSLADRALDDALAREPAGGVDGLVSAFERYMHTCANEPALQRLLAEEPQLAMRVMTGPDGVVQPRLVARVAGLIEAWCPEAITGDLDATDLAYAIVRMGEAFFYADAIAGRPADLHRARLVQHRLLVGR